MSAAPILIAGAGPVGLAAAIALQRSGLRPLLIDARGRDAGARDPRAIALSHGSRLILERIGAWANIVATPIRAIEVSQDRGFGRAHIAAADHGIAALGYVSRLGSLTAALMETALALGIELRFDSTLGRAGTIPGGMLAEVAGTSVETALLVRAEGAAAMPGASIRDYHQSAIVTEAWCRDGHRSCAHERFTRAGPLALLPLETGFSVVWCMQPAQAQQLAELPAAEFMEALQQATRFAPYRWSRIAERHIYPLALTRRSADAALRETALGNAAQSLHPVAGQGFNLGLRDAFELAQALAGGVSDGALAIWRARRRRDRDAMVATTDRYVSLFSNDLAPLRMARGLGLTLIDLVPPLRALVANRMMFGKR